MIRSFVACSRFKLVCGSSAAVCSSSNRMSGRFRVAMRKLSACRCPPDRAPVAVVIRFSRPLFIVAASSVKRARLAFNWRWTRCRRSPRLVARSIFSATVIRGAVPSLGSWNTRARKAVRCSSELLVISTPLWRIWPASTPRLPPITLNRVDFPAPFVPTIVMKLPSLIVRLIPLRIVVSLAVPLLTTVWTSRSSNIGLLMRTDSFQN